ncbi:MAG TPA: pitrilysin family protein, partial [Longimicrobiales bacterium]|nr:pitrilysin family protein [Longimicrobiales bacterium]
MSELDLLAAAPTTVHRLANGMTLVVREDHRNPVVAIVTRVAAGYFDESDDVVGISHVLEHMFFKGTPTRGPGEIGRATKQAGGYLNASTIYNRTQYYTVLPSESLAEGLALQSDALLNAAIDEDELSRELRVIIEEAKRKRDNPTAVATESLFALMHERHRMRRWRIGEETQLAGFRRDHVNGFYRTFYRGPNIVLSVVGDVETDRVIELVERHYGALDGNPVERDRGPEEPEQRGFRYRALRGDVTNAYMEWGWRTQPLLHEDTAALDVLAMVLGHGRASRLYREVRDAGLAHFVDAGNYTPEDLGVFNLSLETTPDLALPALRASADVLRHAADTIGGEELERVRTLTRTRLLRRMETVEGQANLLADWQALGSWEMARSYYEQMLEADADRLREVAGRYLIPERASLLVYAPHGADVPESAAQIEDALFGAVSAAGGGTATRSQDTAGVRSGSAPVSAAPAADLEREEDGVRFYRSGHGARIVVLPLPGSGLVSMAIAAEGGTCAESERQAGITTVLARTALKGTRSYSAAALAERIELLGGSIGASVGSDDFGWTLSLPARNAEAGLALLAEASLHPTFPEEELERERSLTLAQLAQLRDDMYRYPMRLCLAAAFPRHPYGYSLETQEAGLAALGRDDLVEWHRRVMNASSAWCFVVGDVEPDAIAAACAAHLDGARVAADALPCGVPARWPESPARAVVRRPRAQTALALAFPGPRYGDSDADALSLLGSAIGGLGGRLFEQLRSRQSLAYTVSAAPLARRHGGSFHAYIATAPEREEEARESLLRELGLLRTEPIGADELERARRYMIGARRIRRQTNGARLSELMAALLVGRGLEELRDYEDRLMAFDAERLRSAAERWLDPARLVEGVVRGHVEAR